MVYKKYSGEGHRDEINHDIFDISNNFKGKINKNKIQMDATIAKTEFSFLSKTIEGPNFTSDRKEAITDGPLPGNSLLQPSGLSGRYL
jgi:hypothetical protein